MKRGLTASSIHDDGWKGLEPQAIRRRIQGTRGQGRRTVLQEVHAVVGGMRARNLKFPRSQTHLTGSTHRGREWVVPPELSPRHWLPRCVVPPPLTTPLSRRRRALTHTHIHTHHAQRLHRAFPRRRPSDRRGPPAARGEAIEDDNHINGGDRIVIIGSSGGDDDGNTGPAQPSALASPAGSVVGRRRFSSRRPRRAPRASHHCRHRHRQPGRAATAADSPTPE